MTELTAEQIRALTGGRLVGSGERRIREVAPLDEAGPEALSFVATPKYLGYLASSRAGVVLLKPEWEGSLPAQSSGVLVQDPHRALRAVLLHLAPERRPEAGVHPTAVVAPDATLGEGVSVGPYVVIEEGVEIGRNSRIGSHTSIGRGCRVGEDVTIESHVTLYHGVVVGDRGVIHSGARVGKEGFGFVWESGGHRKVPQIGGCRIEEDVEIGTNVTIDRGSVGDTVIGAGSKIDNLVHIGHNVRLGKHVLLIAQVGISGSTSIGDGAILAGQAGVGGHLDIGAGARVGGQAGVTADVPAGETYSGYPARPHRDALRAQAGVFRIPELLRRLKALEARVFGKGTGGEGESG